MGILIDFERTRESESDVEYRFGYPVMDRLLVINKTDLTARPADGPANPTFARVVGKILRLHRERGSWPAGGMYAA